jgi:hypothetical protein
MLVPGPFVDSECIIKILKGNALLVEEFPQIPRIAFLIRGDLAPWPIFKSERMNLVEIAALFGVAGLNPLLLDHYISVYCQPVSPPLEPNGALN